MSAPSSTSSSEPARHRRLAVGTLLGCLATLVLIRLAFAWAGPGWRDRPDLESAAALLRDARGEDVRTVALGSSRMHSAFRPDVWADRAGLEERQVLNLALDNGHFWDARHLLERAGGLPDRVELVLIEVARWNFNRHKVSPLGERVRYDYPEHFRQQGGVLDRWSVDDPLARIRLLAEAVWPVYQRRTVGEWIELARTRSTRPPERGASPHWFARNHRRLRAMRAFRAESIVLDHYHDPALSSFAVRNFALLVEAARTAGAEVVLVTLPTRTAYQRAILSDASRRAFAEAVDRVVAARVGPGVRRVDCPLAADCGLDGRIFVDYGHLHYDGAAALTHALFDRIGGAPRTRTDQDASKWARYASSASS